MVTRPQRVEMEKDFEQTPAGVHKCTLVIKDCMVNKWVDGQKTEQMVQGYRFSFKALDKPYYINTWPMKASCHEKSGVFKMMRMCRDSFLSEIEFNGDGWPIDEDMFFSVLEDLENYTYDVTCEAHDYKGREYTKFVKAKPLGKKEENSSPQAAQEPESVLQSDDGFDDEDIPF